MKQHGKQDILGVICGRQAMQGCLAMAPRRRAEPDCWWGDEGCSDCARFGNEPSVMCGDAQSSDDQVCKGRCMPGQVTAADLGKHKRNNTFLKKYF